MPSIDYYLSCDAAEPKGAEDHYTEELVRLGGLPFSYRRPAKPNPVGRRADYGLREDATIYFLAQNLFKIHPDMDKPLARILREDPTGLFSSLKGKTETGEKPYATGSGRLLARRPIVSSSYRDNRI